MLLDYVIQIRKLQKLSAVWKHLFYTAIFWALVGFMCVFFIIILCVCLMLSWPIPDTECSPSKIDQAAQSSLLILKQSSRIMLPSDVQIRLSGIMMISVIQFWNWGKNAQTASMLWEMRIVFMWRDAGNLNLPITHSYPLLNDLVSRLAKIQCTVYPRANWNPESSKWPLPNNVMESN